MAQKGRGRRNGKAAEQGIIPEDDTDRLHASPPGGLPACWRAYLDRYAKSELGDVPRRRHTEAQSKAPPCVKD